MWWAPQSEFFRNVWSWSGAVYWKSSTPGPLPARTIRICSTTARGSTSTNWCMKSPVGSLKGPNVSGLLPPSACSNQAAAAATFGTVIPT